LTGSFVELGVGRALVGVFLPIGLLLLLAAAGVALKLNVRDSSRKVRVLVGVLGGLLVLAGGWGLFTKPKLTITAVTPEPLQKILRSGEPCPETIDVIAVVRGKGGPDSVGLKLSSEGGRTPTIPMITPMFEFSEKESRQAFGPYPVVLPRNPPRTVLLKVQTTSPPKFKFIAEAPIRNAGCVPRR
jgi:hypothetical protein